MPVLSSSTGPLGSGLIIAPGHDWRGQVWKVVAMQCNAMQPSARPADYSQIPARLCH